MGTAERIHEDNGVAAQSAAAYGSRGVPADWFVDPADESAAERYRAATGQDLEDQATAFLAAHESAAEALHEEAPVAPVRELHSGRAAEATPSTALWIGMPQFPGAEDEGELGWQTEALCAQTDPEAFFPEKGGSTRDAKKVCGACNVRAECLEYALSNDERFGIWGGLSERERRRLRKRAV
ncbi:WhiB family transcriptional regulator [Zafaria sp. Z1313]|uniref:WhiB family transcriptional regulator n=1 Tax=unclassified Zafaria TaxID=2828765 RepID=UPI002E764B74|nr:WhiB family transcriptional regulator [Zafaria sp. J156]MEE1619946.1 WhiB family transcriptional regulator [Zafaria sp. J156]